MDVRSFYGRKPRTVVKRRVRARIPVEKTLRPSARKAVAKIAKRVMKRSMETKYAAVTLSQEGGQAYQVYGDVLPLNGTPQLVPTLPPVNQGDAGFQRIGQSVMPTRHTATLDLEFNNLAQDISGAGGLDACAWDVNVHIWYGFARRYKKASDLDVLVNAQDICNNMLEEGNGSSIRFDGSPHIALMKTNTDVLQVKHKVIRMYRPFGAQNQATLAGGLTTYFPQAIKKRVKLVFKTPKTLKYDEDDGDPENYAPFFIIGYEHNDASRASNNATPAAPPSILTKPAIQFYGRSELWFKDA